jgi:hypothetical protein
LKKGEGTTMSITNWTQKGATLSDKSACKEFGLSQQEILEAINAGKLQYRQNYMHGNPYFRLLREEVENLVAEKYGVAYLQQQQLKRNSLKSTVNYANLRKKSRRLNKEKSISWIELSNKPRGSIRSRGRVIS